jgi:PAS domain S-box-containing protein
MLAEALDCVPCLIFTLGSGGYVQSTNQWAEQYLGAANAKAGTSVRTFVEADDLNVVRTAISDVSAMRSHIKFDARLLRADGSFRWHTVHLKSARGELRASESTAVIVVAVDVHECKRAWRMYEESEQRLRSAFEAADIGAWDWDLVEGVAQVTPVVARLYGIDESISSVPLDTLWLSVIPEHRDCFAARLREGCLSRVPFQIDFAISPQAGKSRWLRMRAQSRDGSTSTSLPRKVFGVTFDITGARAAEAALAVSERRYRELARSSGALVWSSDREGHVYPLDGHWWPYAGFSPDQRPSERWLDLLHPADQQSVLDRWEAALHEPQPCEASFRLRRIDDVYRSMHARAVPLFDEKGEVQEWFGTLTDVTEERNARAASEAQHLRLRLAMEAANIAIVTLNLQTFAIAVEATATNTAAGTPAQRVEIPYDVAFARINPEDRPGLDRGIRCLIAGSERAVAFELRVNLADGEHWMTGSAVLERAEDGTASNIVGSLLDISDRKRMELALRDADKRKDEFLAMLAHELRNPLAPLRTVVAVLKRGSTLREPADLISLMERQITHLTRLVDDLLEVSRITQGRISLKREPLLLGAVVYGAAEAVASSVEDQSQTLTVDIPKETVWLCGDPTRLSQVIVNVLNNSIKYTPAGGSISLSADIDEEQISISIRDTGAGISQELLPHIFDLFTQGEQTLDRSNGGLGIGLSLVRKLVEMHDGSINIESAGAGTGTTVTMRFPRLNHERPTTIATQPDISAPSARLRILIVDDNRDAADSLGLVCEEEGHLVCVCHSSHDALCRHQAFSPDVALLDIGLPDIDGYALAANLRNNASRVPLLIAITGYGQADDRLRALSAGFQHHFVKPVDINALLELLSAFDPGAGTAAKRPPSRE